MNLIRSTNGLAMTEGIIVIPFFIIIWAGLSGIHQGYSAQMKAQSLASSSTLINAGNGNCGNGKISPDAIHGETDIPDISSPEKRLLNKIGGSNPLVPVRAQESADVDSLIFNKTITQKGKRIMTCNTKPINNLMELIVQNIKELTGL